MKNLLTANHNQKYMDIALLILRAGVAFLMLSHGLPKLAKLLSGGEIKFPDPLGIGSKISFILVVFAEAVCSALILIGLATRLATIPLIINMLVIIFIVHAADPFAKIEVSVFYLLVYLVLLISGSGRYSIDNKISGTTSYKAY